LAAKYQDLTVSLTDPKEREKYTLLLEIMTPIVKTYPSEMGKVAVDLGVQVLGGYGFCSDYILQQYLRDIRIFSIYEGTTGIQSQDLLGRKITMENGRAFQLLSAEILSSVQQAMTHESLAPYAKILSDKVGLAQKVVQSLLGFAAKGDYQRFLSDASVFMEFFGNITVAWLWLDMARSAQSALIAGNTDFSKDFYNAKIHAMKFYFKYELPKTTALAEVLTNKEVFTVPTDTKIFA
jgi:butyryl-CoA dehydrogenase